MNTNELIAAVVILCAGIWLWRLGDDPPTVKSHVLNCHSWTLESGTTCPAEDWRHERVITYVLHPQQNQVVVDSGVGQIYTVSGCSIIDRDNWVCQNDTGLAHDFGCRDGAFFDAYDSPWEKRVGRYRYYWARFLDLFQTD